MKPNWPCRGLYAITDAGLTGGDIAKRVSSAIDGGARVVQYRDKSAEHALRERQARALLEVCRAAGIPLLINDDVELAARVGADGVHVGRDDSGLRQARERLGPDAIIGVSCYNRLDLALAAADQGADYVALGRFFASASKPHAVQADLPLLREVRRQLDCPIVAIGGISAENGRPLVEAGADMLAVIRGVFAATDPAAAARLIDRLFHTDAETSA